MTSPDPTGQRGLVGAVLSRRYRLVQKLGDGGMGEVYAAEPVDGRGRVAIKLILPEFLTDVAVLTRFLEEGRTCQRLIHPNIIRVHETLQAEDGTPYIVMELLEGVPLSAYTQNGGRVPLYQACTVLQGILAGLAAAHAEGVVHRDLKPENVFLARDAAGHFVVKVLDFGIAKVMDAAGGMGTKTKTGMLLGTPAYMSPEQIKSARDVDHRADLWSAGVMFYEMLSGRVAFPAPTEYARLSAVLSMTPELLERIDPQLMPMSALVTRALQKDRNQRFGSALDMARALSAVMTELSNMGPQASLVQPLSRLPDVPSLYTPSIQEPSRTPSVQRTESSPPGPPIAKSTGSTLASHAGPIVVQIRESGPPPVVIVSHPTGGTLPSESLPMLEPVKQGPPKLTTRGVASGVVVALVLGALVAGFLLGFAVARL